METASAAAIGVLIGLVTGLVFMLLVRTGFRGTLSIKDLSVLAAELMALPAFWFGGSWLTRTLDRINFGENLNAYVLALTVTFVFIQLIPLYHILVNYGNLLEVKERGGGDGA